MVPIYRDTTKATVVTIIGYNKAGYLLYSLPSTLTIPVSMPGYNGWGKLITAIDGVVAPYVLTNFGMIIH